MAGLRPTSGYGGFDFLHALTQLQEITVGVVGPQRLVVGVGPEACRLRAVEDSSR